MTSIQESIVKAMNARNMSQAELSRLSGVSKSSLSRYLGGDDIPASKLKAIADALGVTVDMLLGISRPESLTADERELLSLYRKMDVRERSLLMENARAFAALSEKDGAGSPQDVGRAGIVVSA